MPGSAPSNRPPKGQAKPRKWKQARDADRDARKPQTVKVPRAPSALQIAQAADRELARQTKKAERKQRLEHLAELRTRAVQAGLVEHGLDPIHVLQRLIDDAFIAYLLAGQEYDSYLAEHPELDQLKDPFHSKVKEARRLEKRTHAYRREAAYFTGLSVQYNLQDRQTRVAEARISLFMQVMQQSLRHPDIDLPPDQVKLIPKIMKEKLLELQSGNGNSNNGNNGKDGHA